MSLFEKSKNEKLLKAAEKGAYSRELESSS
jgi:hypothetical protein